MSVPQNFKINAFAHVCILIKAVLRVQIIFRGRRRRVYESFRGSQTKEEIVTNERPFVVSKNLISDRRRPSVLQRGFVLSAQALFLTTSSPFPSSASKKPTRFIHKRAFPERVNITRRAHYKVKAERTHGNSGHIYAHIDGVGFHGGVLKTDRSTRVRYTYNIVHNIDMYGQSQG